LAPSPLTLLSLSSAARQLRVDPDTLKELIATNALQTVRVGKRVKIAQCVLQNFVEGKTPAAGRKS